MANTLLTPTLVAKEAMAVLQNNLVMGNLVYRDADTSMPARGIGTTINIRKPRNIAARLFAGSTVTQDAITEDTVAVTLDKHMYIQVPLTTTDMALNIQDFSEQVIKPAIVGHAEAIDAALCGLYVDASGWVAQTGTAVVADIANLGKQLSINKAPMSDRRLVLSPTAKAKYIVLDAVLHADKRATDGAIRDAEVGRVLGLDTYEDQNIKTHTQGTAVTGSGAATGTAGASTVALGSLSGATVTIVKGDIFTIAGDATQYVATESKTASSSAIASLAIAPKLAATCSGAAITILDTTGENSLAFHKNAFALVTRPLPAPMGGATGAVMNYNGFSMRVVYGWDNTLLSDTVTIDCLWGVKTLDPTQAVRFVP